MRVMKSKIKLDTTTERLHEARERDFHRLGRWWTMPEKVPSCERSSDGYGCDLWKTYEYPTARLRRAVGAIVITIPYPQRDIHMKGGVS